MRRNRVGILCLAVVGALAMRPASAAALQPDSVPAYTAAAPGGEIGFRDSGGRGAAVLFVSLSGARLWDRQIAAITHAGYRFIALDYRGGPVEAASRIDALVTLLGLRKLHLVGSGGGAVAAMRYTLRHPDKVRSLTAGNTLVGLRDADFNTLEKRLRSPEFDAMPREWRELGPTYRALDPDGVKAWLALTERPAPPAPTAMRTSAPPPPDLEDEVTWARLQRLQVPVLMLTGDADPYTPPGIMRAFVRRLRGSQGVVIPDSGHTAFWENPAAYNRSLLRFLAQNR